MYQPNYSALSRYGGGSLRMTTTTTATNNKIIGPNNSQYTRQDSNSKIESPHPNLKNAVNQTNNNSKRKPQYHRCQSDSSQSTVFTTMTHIDTCDNCINASSNKISEVPTKTANTLTTIAEKLRRGTRKVFQMTSSSSPSSTVSQSTPNPTVLQSISQILDKDINPNVSMGHQHAIDSKDRLKKLISIESSRTNTISNSSLQELDEDMNSTELTKFMGEINNEIKIKQDRTVLSNDCNDRI